MGKRTNTAKWMENQKRWQINVQKDGIRRSFTSSKPGRTGQREANAKADVWLDAGIEGGSEKIVVLYFEYINYIKANGTRSNWQPAESKGNAWIIPAIGNKRIQNVTEQDLQAILDKAHSLGRSRKTIMNIRGTLVNFFKFCKRKRYPIPDISEMKIPESARYRGKNVVQPDGLKTLFQVDETVYRGKRQFEPLIYAFRFQVLSGLRPGELRGLRWGDIKGDTVYLSRSVNSFNETTLGKNQNAIRSFHLTPQMKFVLEQQHQLSENIKPNDAVFETTGTGNYLKRWQKYCESNDIPPTTAYELRHTFVSIAKNLPEGQLKALVGHSHNMDTYGVYSHTLVGESEETAANLANIFNAILEK